jgi:cytochrome c553
LTDSPDDGTRLQVPDSDAAFTLIQIRDLNFCPDWHPGDHPPMPEIVARGRRPAVLACGSCHRADGSGGPENARVAGLPGAYIAQQMADFKSGARGGPLSGGGAIAKALTDAETEEAAKYYAGLSPMRSARIIESTNAPKTTVGRDSQRIKLPGNETEPLGKRIVEFAEASAEAPFAAYVPVGSLAAGKLVIEGSKSEECESCHGDGLKGSHDNPSLAGRSPVYIARQLYDIQIGNRNGPWTQLMKEAVAKLTGREPFATLNGVYMARHRMFFTSTKAEQALAYRARPYARGLEDAVRWFRDNGYLGP